MTDHRTYIRSDPASGLGYVFCGDCGWTSTTHADPLSLRAWSVGHADGAWADPDVLKSAAA